MIDRVKPVTQNLLLGQWRQWQRKRTGTETRPWCTTGSTTQADRRNLHCRLVCICICLLRMDLKKLMNIISIWARYDVFDRKRDIHYMWAFRWSLVKSLLVLYWYVCIKMSVVEISVEVLLLMFENHRTYWNCGVFSSYWHRLYFLNIDS